jgi:hypothetical protein
MTPTSFGATVKCGKYLYGAASPGWRSPQTGIARMAMPTTRTTGLATILLRPASRSFFTQWTIKAKLATMDTMMRPRIGHLIRDDSPRRCANPLNVPRAP